MDVIQESIINKQVFPRRDSRLINRSIRFSPSSLLGFTIIDRGPYDRKFIPGTILHPSPPLPKPLIASQPPNENFALDSVLASRAKLSDADRINMQIYSDIVLESLDL